MGNVCYKEKAKGKGSWIEQGGNRPAPFLDWIPPKAWKVSTHAKHLRNLYVYFWRWAAWKVFEQGAGGGDRVPPVAEKLSGIVCYITVSGFLNGPGFQKMRADLRRDCDEVWVIDCSPEGHQPEVATRIFQGVQHPVCIVLASRSPATDPAKPARVRFRALRPGRRELKFDELAGISLDSQGWSECPSGWRESFLPSAGGGWAEFWPLDHVIGDSGSGVMPGRTWIIAPDQVSLTRRWERLVNEPQAEKRASLFHPHLRNGLPGDKHVAKPSGLLPGQHPAVKSIEAAIKERANQDPTIARGAAEMLRCRPPVAYGFRSFDRQWMIPDSRVINQANPGLWGAHGHRQIYIAAPMDRAPTAGPSLSVSSAIPDLHFYNGRGGRVFALWKDNSAQTTNLSAAALKALSKVHGGGVDPADLFSYVVGLLANPAYTQRFAPDLLRPGLRVPLTADAALFAEAATLGRQVIWLHTFGERCNDGKPPGPPRAAINPPIVPKGGAIPVTPEGFPDTIDYDAALNRLHVGSGFLDNVSPAVWAYEVSGKNVLRQWFSYRRRNRERPQIGDRRPPSPLGDIQPDHWLPEYTSELINVLNVLTLLIELEPLQADLLSRIVDGPLVSPPVAGGLSSGEGSPSQG